MAQKTRSKTTENKNGTWLSDLGISSFHSYIHSSDKCVVIISPDARHVECKIQGLSSFNGPGPMVSSLLGWPPIILVSWYSYPPMVNSVVTGMMMGK